LDFARRVARARTVGAIARLVLQASRSLVRSPAVQRVLVDRLQLAKAKRALALPQASQSLVRAPVVQRVLVGRLQLAKAKHALALPQA
jgi:hypothetical protein